MPRGPHAPRCTTTVPIVADIWSTLQRRVRASGGAPLVTYLDAQTRERTELSATSLANAAAKIANALLDEYDLEPGAVIALDLPLHWQRSAWCAGAWTAGCVVVPGAADADLRVTTLERVRPENRDTLVVSMHPFGLPIEDALPDGVQDATLAVRRQPDAYLGAPPQAGDAALALPTGTLDQSALLDAARDLAERVGLEPGGCLLVTDAADPDDAWLGCLPVPLARDASVVLLHGGDVDALIAQERVTARAPTASG